MQMMVSVSIISKLKPMCQGISCFVLPRFWKTERCLYLMFSWRMLEITVVWQTMEVDKSNWMSIWRSMVRVMDGGLVIGWVGQ